MQTKEILEALADWDKVTSDNDEEFKKEFCKYAWAVTKVSWSSENMRFVYILDCGQSVVDSVKIEKWINFLEKYNK